MDGLRTKNNNKINKIKDKKVTSNEVIAGDNKDELIFHKHLRRQLTLFDKV